MKYRILKIIALLLILCHLTSCFHHIRTDREYYGHKRYRHSGNYW